MNMMVNFFMYEYLDTILISAMYIICWVWHNSNISNSFDAFFYENILCMRCIYEGLGGRVIYTQLYLLIGFFVLENYSTTFFMRVKWTYIFGWTHECIHKEYDAVSYIWQITMMIQDAVLHTDYVFYSFFNICTLTCFKIWKAQFT